MLILGRLRIVYGFFLVAVALWGLMYDDGAHGSPMVGTGLARSRRVITLARAFYACYYGASACLMPFLAVYYNDLGFSVVGRLGSCVVSRRW